MKRSVPMFLAATLATLAVAGSLILGVSRQAAGAAQWQLLAPPPALDSSVPGHSREQTAILSGGCFWGMQLVFQHVRGVRAVLSGYTGGARDTAHYEQVATGTTGHAESVEIRFDPRVITYGTLLRVYFSVATNPTELDYQGPDQGSQYRGMIWTNNAEQRRIAHAYLRQLRSARVFSAPIVTRIEPAMPFYPAESYHQNFATRHPYNLYIMTYDAPKLAALRRLFPAL